MVTSARFKFTATLVGAVLAVVLTLVAGDDGDSAGSPVHVAHRLLPAPR